VREGNFLGAINKAPATVRCDEGLGSIAIEKANRENGLARGGVLLRQSVQTSLDGGELFVSEDPAAHGLKGL